MFLLLMCSYKVGTCIVLVLKGTPVWPLIQRAAYSSLPLILGDNSVQRNAYFKWPPFHC